MKKNELINVAQVYTFLATIIGPDLHAKRILSLANATIGVVHSCSLAVSTIGRALAQVNGSDAKHVIKQVDRMLSNKGIDVWELFKLWVPYVVGTRQEIIVALDWTEFDADDQSTIALHMITRHGRATPLIWKTITKSKLKGWRNAHEDDVLVRLYEVIDDSAKVTVLADRGFGDAKLYDFHKILEFDHIIRFRGEIAVENEQGETKPARDWLNPGGRARILRNVKVTHQRIPISAFVCVHAKGMKEPWFLAIGGKRALQSASFLVKLYGRRFTIEEGFRDSKDLRFGMGLSSSHISKPERRDRILLLNAFAVSLLTLLGAAGEELGYDRRLRANTSKRRTHSLFFQGHYYYGSIPNMKEERLLPLMQKFSEFLIEQPIFNRVFGYI